MAGVVTFVQFGAIYGVIGAKSLIKINVVDRDRCDRCMDCYNVCPEPQVLRLPLHGGPEDSQIILAKDCITCGRCIDVCAEKCIYILALDLRNK